MTQRETELLVACNRELEKRRAAEDKANGAIAMLYAVQCDLGEVLSFAKFVKDKLAWSVATFGEGERTEGICRHIEKELAEIRREPHDLVEWIDVILLAIDGYCRAGGKPEHLLRDLVRKHEVNLTRKWSSPVDGQPVEHVREDSNA